MASPASEACGSTSTFSPDAAKARVRMARGCGTAGQGDGTHHARHQRMLRQSRHHRLHVRHIRRN
eukprot:2359715-Rhodomonas_salina.3